jgi:hypothetical protein
MTKVLTITGLKETQMNLEVINAKMIIVRSEIANRLSDRGLLRAKQLVGIETGALKDSIHKAVIEQNPARTRMRVTAGNPRIARGVGKYSLIKAKRTGGGMPRTVSFKSTVEYAAPHDLKSGYMRGAFNLIKASVMRVAQDVLRRTIR